MVLSDLTGRLRSMSNAMPELVISQRRAVANASAAVERDRRAAAERSAAERSADLDSVRAFLTSDAGWRPAG